MLILSLVYSFDNNVLAYVISSFIALPYTIYSIYYQWRVAGSWCRMCLAVQGVLFLLAILSLILLTSDCYICRLEEFLSMTIIVMLVICGYFTAKYILKSLLIKKAVSEQYRQFKFDNLNYNLSDTLKPIEEKFKIIFNESASDKITIAFRFDCIPCLYNMGNVIETIHKNPNIAVEFIFVSWASRLKKDLPIILHFAELYVEEHNRFLSEINHYVSDYPSKIGNYSSKPDKIGDQVRSIITSHIKWSTENNINQTPTYLLNDRIVSSYYKFTELVDIINSKKLL